MLNQVPYPGAHPASCSMICGDETAPSIARILTRNTLMEIGDVIYDLQLEVSSQIRTGSALLAAQYVSAIPIDTPFRTVIDVGCGWGNSLATLCEEVRSIRQITGIDHYNQPLTVARNFWGEDMGPVIEILGRHLSADGLYSPELIASNIRQLKAWHRRLKPIRSRIESQFLQFEMPDALPSAALAPADLLLFNAAFELMLYERNQAPSLLELFAPLVRVGGIVMIATGNHMVSSGDPALDAEHWLKSAVGASALPEMTALATDILMGRPAQQGLHAGIQNEHNYALDLKTMSFGSPSFNFMGYRRTEVRSGLPFRWVIRQLAYNALFGNLSNDGREVIAAIDEAERYMVPGWQEQDYNRYQAYVFAFRRLPDGARAEEFTRLNNEHGLEPHGHVSPHPLINFFDW